MQRRKRFKRVISGKTAQASQLYEQIGLSIEENIFGRFQQMKVVKRFVGGWVLFWFFLAAVTGLQLSNLSAYFQTIKPIPGGIYNEGILGTLTNVNPIYATSEVDTSLSKLIFAGLFSYNDQNKLIDDLASGYTISPSGKVYTINLRPGLRWQDGRPLTAADVVYTIQTIQNPNAQSPQYSSWSGVNVSEINPTTVRFVLPNPLASFIYNLTIGIIPEHILSKIAPSDLRAALFNTDHPVGAGPFSWHAIDVSGNAPENAEEQIALKPFSDYALGKPKLGEFIVDAYANSTQLINSFISGQLNAIAGLDQVPAAVRRMPGVQVHSFILTAGDYVFFKTQGDILSDSSIRQALVLGSNPSAIISQLGYSTIPVTEPILLGQLAFNAKYKQVTNQPIKADTILTNDGWNLGVGGYRYKNSQQLSFNMVITDTPENQLVASLLKKQWKKIGVNLVIISESAATYTTTIQDHNYDSTLDGISIGIDPDVFVYWDSSQYDPRSGGLNLSEFDVQSADQALEAGRTRLTPALRVLKYQPFLSDWQKDAPALGLYQPRSIYITKGAVYNLNNQQINSPQDRYDNVQNWEIVRAGVTDSRP